MNLLGKKSPEDRDSVVIGNELLRAAGDDVTDPVPDKLDIEGFGKNIGSAQIERTDLVLDLIRRGNNHNGYLTKLRVLDHSLKYRKSVDDRHDKVKEHDSHVLVLMKQVKRHFSVFSHEDLEIIIKRFTQKDSVRKSVIDNEHLEFLSRICH